MKKWILLVLLLSGVFLFVFLGKIIVKNEKPERADAILILLGGSGDRIDFASELYRKHFAPKVFMIRAVDSASAIKNKHLVPLSSIPEAMKAYIANRGVASDDIIILPGPSGNTLGEARNMAAYCRVYSEIQKLLVITSSAHSGRASLMFKREFRKAKLNTEVIVPLNPYSDYDPNIWWKRNRKVTLSEFVKMAGYFLFSPFL